jgi:hypothetical protein
VLGYQHNEQDLPYLLEVAKDETKVGQFGLIRAGALKGNWMGIVMLHMYIF